METRRFEARQANEFLETMIANADDGLVEAYVSDLAERAGLSRVQAQVGLRVLIDHQRVVVERRGRRSTPGQFRIVDPTPVQPAGEAEPVPLTAARATARAATPPPSPYRPDSSDHIELIRRENAALRTEINALRERIAVLELQLQTLPGPGVPGSASRGAAAYR